MKQYTTLILALLLIGSMVNETWAAKVTYHILTLPIDNSIYHMVSGVNGHRLEAVKVVVDNQTSVELPAHYKSPLATGFTYYAPSEITIGSTVQLYENNTNTKGTLYDVNVTPTATAEGTTISGSTAEYYVVYTYNSSNTIAQLNGSVSYNIGIKNKGFLSYNRGRNNRPAVVPKAKVDAEMLASPDFMKIESPGGGITTYWSSGDNKNKREDVESQFHFIFHFEGIDPYNIIISTSYNRNITYIEKNDNVKPDQFVYKWYKEGSLFAAGTANCYIASDEHKRYKTQYDSSSPNPEDPAYDARLGNYHGQTGTIWGSFALLNNNNLDGYVFMGTRTVDNNGVVPTPGNDNKYYYLQFGGNNLNITKQTAADATKNYTTEGIYPIKNVNFKVKTPFYALASTDIDKTAHTVTATAKLSQYTLADGSIDPAFIPAELRRKYCNFTTFRDKNGKAITKYKDAYNAETGEYDIFVDYEVQNAPFTAITPKSTYTEAELKAASWYELTDDGSTEASGKKIDYVSSNFKNNGASGTFNKTSEFAFIGDPYELRVISRSQTSGGTPSYVGAATTSNGTDFTASTTASAGYLWEMPYDATVGSFRLRIFSANCSGEGYWSWATGNVSVAVIYRTNKTVEDALTKNPQTITLNVSGLTYADGNYLTVEAGGTDASQVESISVGDISSVGTATITATIAGNASEANKTFKLTITEMTQGGATVGSATDVNFTQGTSAYTGGNVEYNATATRVKVLALPTRTFTYKIVDRAGRIAVTATATQTIYSPLSLASIPSIIISPFIVDETITFYDTYSGGGRGNLSGAITETPNANAPIYVKYTTTNLNAKPFKLSEDQEIFVRLNGEYIYYDAGTLKSSAASGATDGYKWKLRNQDPYAMLIDNMGARTHLEVTGSESVILPTDDNGTTASQSRQKGAWVDVASIVNEGTLSFTTTRADAQQFIAKSSARAGVYEVMVATGDGVDANTTYYNIGRPDENTVKIYSNATYQATDDDEIKFRLEENVTYTYHLIDKAKHELLTVESNSPELVLPAEYQSPLVGASNYSYYSLDQLTIDKSKTPWEYTPTNPAVKLSTITDLDALFPAGVEASNSTEYTDASSDYKHEIGNEADIQSEAKKLTTTGYHYYNVNEGTSYKKVNITRAYQGTDIYVTYVKNNLVTFNDNNSPYLLKFLVPHAGGYYLEDGADKLTTGKIEAVYPYTNGDGNLNIYGTEMNKEQMDGGASTRPRWVWFFESDNSDPYHVKIHSKSTISYNGVSYPTYLQTYAVHFNQDASSTDYHIVTGGVLTGIASIAPTEYMVLGTEEHYKLLTTNPINETVVNGTADKDKRYYVNSFEQYWKTYNMIKQHVLEINVKTDPNYKDAFSNNESTWTVPEAVRSTLNTKLEAKGLGIGSGNDQWHSYDAYANATRWNGYNDKESGHEKKVVEELEHWFQTFDMGTQGTFDIISADIPPVLVLLDRHGWEIMRKPLPKISSYPAGDELEALRVYDSPMVKEYKFYSNATKASGCHKYSLRMQNGAERDQIKVDGVHYTSTSLADLPPITASGVKSSGALNDQFVTYTVKDEYEESFTYNFVDHGNNTFTESGTASKFVMLQNKRFYKHRNDESAGKESYISKPIYEFCNPEGGNVYDLILSPRNASVSEVESGGKLTDNCKWYVMPNLNIDKEMGIKYASTSGGSGEPLTEYETKKNYFETGKGGFDPYNIQLKNAGTGTFLTSHMTSTALNEGTMEGTYDSGTDAKTTRITLETEETSYPDPELSTGSTGYDHTNIAMTNQTFMAVSDANGNMQLMPRFDHSKRVNVPTNKISDALLWSTTLEDPVNHAKANIEDNNSMGPQTTFFVRSQVFTYRIIDNDGNEALRYRRSGDYYPTITEHFKSPLAKDFKFYYDHAAYTSSVSTEAAYTAAATSTAFQKYATNDAALATAAKALTVVEDYYFKIGESAPFTYKKVTVTKAHSGSDDATYTTTDCSETDWTNAIVHKEERVADLAALQTAVDNLAVAGNYYYEIGPYVKDAVETYIYRKIVVTSGKSNFLTDVHDKNDISDKEITGHALAEFDFDADEGEVFVRYSYNEDADKEGDKILLGKWFTVKLDDKDMVASGSVVTTDNQATEGVDERGTGVTLLQGTSKPDPITATEKTWQWKFLAAPIDVSSEFHKSPDPYAIQIFNRNANYADNLDEPSPMKFPIKVNGVDRFTLLNHPSGGYALAVNGLASTIDYKFLNGAGMDTDDPAATYSENRQKITVDNEAAYTTARAALTIDGEYYYKYGDNYKKVIVTSGTPDAGTIITSDDWVAADTYSFTIKTNTLSPGTQLVLNDDVTHNYNYSVINNGGSDYVVANPGFLAIEATQDNDAASDNGFAPYLPVEAQTELLNADEDYLYYGSATKDNKGTDDTSDDTYTVATITKLFTLYGLYDDQVYVRYQKYDPDKGVYQVPNKRNAKESTTVARDPGSHDVALNIKGELPYNIIWYDNNMMSTETEDATTITDGGKQDLSGLKQYVWYFEGNDPYALKIRHKLSSNYVDGTGTLVADAASAMQFMLLKKMGYDYGVLAKMGDKNNMLSFDDDDSNPSPPPIVSLKSTPNKFIIFGLSVHDLIYRLIIAKSCANKTSPGSGEFVDIPSSDSNPEDPNYIRNTKKLRVYGTTQRDLESKEGDNEANPEGSKYQLGETLVWGGVSHTYSHDAGTVSIGDVLEVPSVFYRPNCTFEFYIEGVYDYDKETGATKENTGLNAKYKGLKLKNLMSDSELIDKTVVVNIVYLFDQTVATNTGLGFVTSTDQDLWYTFETNESTPYLARYTNTHKLTAVSGKATRYTNDYLFTPLGDVYGFKMYNRYVLKNSNTENGKDESKVMTTTTLAANSELDVAVPGGSGYEVYELLKGDVDGYFRVHPVVNYNTGVGEYTALYVNVVDNKLKLSTTPRDWAYGLDIAMLQPYYLGAGNVGGLTTTPKSGSGKSGKELYEEALAKEPFMITDLQAVVYDYRNIVDFKTGYYRLHSQPGISGISPVRYASGYLHNIEKTAGAGSTAIPMHFYSKVGVTGTFDGDTNPLESGFTVSNATRGDIPVPATEADPSTIFYVNGTSYDNKTISDVTLSTQGLNVIGCTMGTGSATTYRLIDIGGGVVILVDGSNYLNFTQTPTSTIYDLKYSAPTAARLDDVKWCMEPANSQGLKIAVNNGGDDYYYATFCAPFDVALPDDEDDGSKTYNAYICKQWHDEGVHPVPVPARTVSATNYSEGKYVPAGTPVIIRVKDESGSIQLTLPRSTPSASPVSGNIFSGKYLEQLLDNGAGNEVYTLGLPFTSTVTKDGDYANKGEITAPLPKQASSGVGFYINATPNKEVNATEGNWKRNNRYVLHNKIYYRSGSSGASSREKTRGVEFVPVIFDDENGEDPDIKDNSDRIIGDGCVYDLQGRKVATKQQVDDGTWSQFLRPGIYIINGKKIRL